MTQTLSWSHLGFRWIFFRVYKLTPTVGSLWIGCSTFQLCSFSINLFFYTFYYCFRLIWVISQKRSWDFVSKLDTKRESRTFYKWLITDFNFHSHKLRYSNNCFLSFCFVSSHFPLLTGTQLIRLLVEREKFTVIEIKIRFETECIVHENVADLNNLLTRFSIFWFIDIMIKMFHFLWYWYVQTNKSKHDSFDLECELKVGSSAWGNGMIAVLRLLKYFHELFIHNPFVKIFPVFYNVRAFGSNFLVFFYQNSLEMKFCRIWSRWTFLASRPNSPDNYIVNTKKIVWETEANFVSLPYI